MNSHSQSDQLEADYAKIAQNNWNAERSPHQEKDSAIEFLSQPIEGERNPQVRAMTKQMTLDYGYQGRDIEM